MTFSFRLNDEDTALIKKFAQMNSISVSELVRQTLLERIEEEYDLEVFRKAYAEFEKNPVTYSLDEVKKELEII